MLECRETIYETNVDMSWPGRDCELDATRPAQQSIGGQDWRENAIINSCGNTSRQGSGTARCYRRTGGTCLLPVLVPWLLHTHGQGSRRSPCTSLTGGPGASSPTAARSLTGLPSVGFAAPSGNTPRATCSPRGTRCPVSSFSSRTDRPLVVLLPLPFLRRPSVSVT